MIRRLVVVLLGVALAALLALVPASAPEARVAARTTSPWTLVVDDQFNAGGLPPHWSTYDGPYGSGPQNCARPDHSFVSDGRLRMVLRYRTSGDCGPGWYSAGLRLVKRFDSVDQRISVRFRVLQFGGVVGHRIIPMRWPASGDWVDPGEEDFCEGDHLTTCTTFLHHDGVQEYHVYRVDLTTWHTMTFVRRNFTVGAYIDGQRRWFYRGNEDTLPSTPKHPVLQQECQKDGCPAGTAGREVIVIDWIRVWNPAP